MTPVFPRAETNWFNRDVIGLRIKATRSAKLGVIGQAATLVLGTLSMAALSRLLNPDDVGLFALASSVVGFLSVVLETGFPYSLMQRSELDDEQASAYFWFMLMLSLVGASLGCAVAIPVGWVFGRPEVASIVAVLSLGLPFTTFGMTHSVILRRNMRQGAMVISGIVASILSIGAAIAAAAMGWGWWALVIQALVCSASKSALWWCLCSWRPGLPRRGSGVRDLVRTGSLWTSSEFIGLARRSIDQLMLGWWWGADAVGLYSRGLALSSLMFTQGIVPITTAVWPALVRLQGEPDRLRAATLKIADGIFFVAVPASTWLIVGAEPLVSLMLGDQWVVSARITQVSTIGVLFAATLGSVTFLYASATGNVRALARTSWLAFPMTILGTLSTIHLGAQAVAVALSAVSAITSVMGLRIALAGSVLSPAAVIARLGFPALNSFLAGFLSILFDRSFAGAWPSVSRLLATFGIISSGYITMWCVTKGGRAHVLAMLEVALGVRGARLLALVRRAI